MMPRTLLALLVPLLPLPLQAQATAQMPSASTPANWPSPVEDNPILTYWIFNQLEARTGSNGSSLRWDGEGWIGDDFNKLWIKSQGRIDGGKMSDGDQEFLYDRPVSHLRYLDWQAGVRADLDSGPGRLWGAVGLEGLLPYSFEIEPTLYFRGGGNVAGRLAGSYNLRITQRLILQPQIELNWYSRRDQARRVGAGLSELDGGLRLGYRLSRKFTPYVGFTYTNSYGETARFERLAGPAGVCSRCFVFGVSAWR